MVIVFRVHILKEALDLHKEIRVKPKFETVETRVEVPVFITEDGKEFYKEDEALRHERTLAIQKKEITLQQDKVKTFYYLTGVENLYDLRFETFASNPDKHGIVFPGWYLLEKKHEAYQWGPPLETVQSLSSFKEELEIALRTLS